MTVHGFPKSIEPVLREVSSGLSLSKPKRMGGLYKNSVSGIVDGCSVGLWGAVWEAASPMNIDIDSPFFAGQMLAAGGDHELTVAIMEQLKEPVPYWGYRVGPSVPSKSRRTVWEVSPQGFVSPDGKLPGASLEGSDSESVVARIGEIYATEGGFDVLAMPVLSIDGPKVRFASRRTDRDAATHVAVIRLLIGLSHDLERLLTT